MCFSTHQYTMHGAEIVAVLDPTTVRWATGQYSCTGPGFAETAQKTTASYNYSIQHGCLPLPTFAERAFVCACIFFQSAQHLPEDEMDPSGFSCEDIKGREDAVLVSYTSGTTRVVQGRSFEPHTVRSSLGQAATPCHYSATTAMLTSTVRSFIGRD
jgi:hypothetical protein